jgi:hypothetical protein
VDDLVLRLFDLEVRNIERPDVLDGLTQSLIGMATAALGPHLSEQSQHPRAIEPLSLAVFAVAHEPILTQ